MRDYFDSCIPKINAAVNEVLPEHITKDWAKNNINTSYVVDENHFTNSISKPFYTLFNRGGKRVRSVLVCLFFDMYRDIHSSADIFKFSTIPEILHNGTLMEDDIEDSSSSRRGGPSSHIEHSIPVTLNAGNFLYYLAQNIVMNHPNTEDLDCHMRSLILKHLSDSMLQLHAGQALDIVWSRDKNFNISIEEYLQMCTYKTGELIFFSVILGVILSGNYKKLSDDEIATLRKVSHNTGIAFQIRDDILNLKPTSEWGKDCGEDITEGKFTYVAIDAINKLENSDELKSILKSNTKDIDQIKRAIQIMDETNSFETATKYATDLINEAKGLTKTILPDNHYKEIFLEFLSFVIQRQK